jgi:hypothetical protein
VTAAPQRRYLPSVPAVRRPPARVTPLPSAPPSSVIAWAWYVDGVRRPAENMTTAAAWPEPARFRLARVFSRQGKHEVERVYQLKRELIEFKRSVMPLGAPLLWLATQDLPVIPPESRAYFRELADHHTEAREAVASFDEVLA